MVGILSGVDRVNGRKLGKLKSTKTELFSTFIKEPSKKKYQRMLKIKCIFFLSI